MQFQSDILASIIVLTCREHKLHYLQNSAPYNIATQMSEDLKSENGTFGRVKIGLQILLTSIHFLRYLGYAGTGSTACTTEEFMLPKKKNSACLG